MTPFWTTLAGWNWRLFSVGSEKSVAVLNKPILSNVKARQQALGMHRHKHKHRADW